MLKPSLYILQLLSILVLVCCYLLSDQPDSLSVMHFNTDSSSQYVIRGKTKDNINNGSLQESVTNQDNTSKKINTAKYVSYEIVLTQPIRSLYSSFKTDAGHSLFPEDYEYLFFTEINPPPPKKC